MNWQEIANNLQRNDENTFKKVNSDLENTLTLAETAILDEKDSLYAFTVLGILFRDEKVNITVDQQVSLLDVLEKEFHSRLDTGFRCLVLWFLGTQKKMIQNDRIFDIIHSGFKIVNPKAVFECLQGILSILKRVPEDAIRNAEKWVMDVILNLLVPGNVNLCLEILSSPHLDETYRCIPSKVAKMVSDSHKTLSDTISSRFNGNWNNASIIIENLKIIGYIMIWGGKYTIGTHGGLPYTTFFGKAFVGKNPEVRIQAMISWRNFMLNLLYSNDEVDQDQYNAFLNTSLSPVTYSAKAEKDVSVRLEMYKTWIFFLREYRLKFTSKNTIWKEYLASIDEYARIEMDPACFKVCGEFLASCVDQGFNWGSFMRTQLLPHRADSLIQFFRELVNVHCNSPKTIGFLVEFLGEIYGNCPSSWNKTEWIRLIQEKTKCLLSIESVNREVLHEKWKLIPKNLFSHLSDPFVQQDFLFVIRPNMSETLINDILTLDQWKYFAKKLNAKDSSEIFSRFLALPLERNWKVIDLGQVWKDTLTLGKQHFSDVAHMIMSKTSPNNLALCVYCFDTMCRIFSDHQIGKLSNLIMLGQKLVNLGKTIDPSITLLLNSPETSKDGGKKLLLLLNHCPDILMGSPLVWKTLLERFESSCALNDDFFREIQDKFVVALDREALNTHTHELLQRNFKHLPQTLRDRVKKRKQQEGQFIEPPPKVPTENVFVDLIGCKDTLRHNLFEFSQVGDLAQKNIKDVPDKVNTNDLREWLEKEYSFSVAMNRTWSKRDKIEKINKEELFEIQEKLLEMQRMVANAIRK